MQPLCSLGMPHPMSHCPADNTHGLSVGLGKTGTSGAARLSFTLLRHRLCSPAAGRRSRRKEAGAGHAEAGVVGWELCSASL